MEKKHSEMFKSFLKVIYQNLYIFKYKKYHFYKL